jgi:hypothetical protein
VSMELYSLIDLATDKVNVSGRVADVRSRYATGDLRYLGQDANRPRITKMKCVYWSRPKRDKHTGEWHRWLYWEWEPIAGQQGQCCFSGIREDLARDENVHIKMEAVT